jgi:hypothetical protein
MPPQADRDEPESRRLLRADELERFIIGVLETAPVCDIHTHLFPPHFGDLLRWGIDELLTYHYLVAEYFRTAPAMEPEEFARLPKNAQAELIWRELFVERSPLSEAARGVVTCLNRLGLDPRPGDLDALRQHFASRTVEQQLEQVLAISNVHRIVMTNDPFDRSELKYWSAQTRFDERFVPSLRLDTLVNGCATSGARLPQQDFAVEPEPDEATIESFYDFLRGWIICMKPLYLALAPPPEFTYFGPAAGERIFEEVVLPCAVQYDLPLVLMLGCRRGVNPRLGPAGDGVARVDLAPLTRLCGEYPKLRLLVTALSWENQNELIVLARKFANLHLFGCWWFLNTPTAAGQITALRLELLGHSFTAQHSDARVLEHLIYKWADARSMLAKVLIPKYAALLAAGWPLTREAVRREITDLLGAGAMRFLGR